MLRVAGSILAQIMLNVCAVYSRCSRGMGYRQTLAAIKLFASLILPFIQVVALVPVHGIEGSKLLRHCFQCFMQINEICLATAGIVIAGKR